MSAQPELVRSLGTLDAIVIGLGSMIGAGIFAALGPAAAAAGAGLLIGLVIAAVVAFCNATSSAQLAAQYPTSGGTYVYGRERLGEWSGFLAGWSFVIGKTASCAAMALTFAAYAAPGEWQKPVAVGAVLGLTAVNFFGVSRTSAAAKIIVSVVLVVLGIVVLSGIGAAGPAGAASEDAGEMALFDPGLGWYGILQSAGLLFFAFAGYARIATLGEEVKDPERTIPRAIMIALGAVLVVYALVAVTALLGLGPERLAASNAPLADLVAGGSWLWAVPLVQVGAAVACLGALLALIAGVGRTSLAMARNRDLPGALAVVHPRYRVPHHAEITLALVVSVLVLVGDLRQAIGFSSFGVLLYYFIANASAFTQGSSRRRYPKGFQVLGAFGCLILVATLPLLSIVSGMAVVLVGVAYRLLRLRRDLRSAPSPH